MLEDGPRLWAAVLAGGFGARMTAITRELSGLDTRLGQAALAKAQSALVDAVARLTPLVPAERICLVVDRADEAAARHALAAHGDFTFLVQPQDLGTAPAALLALAHVRRSERHARVAVLSATDHVSDPAVFLDTLELADVCTQLDRSTVCTVGGPAGQGGERWIVSGPAIGRFGLRRASGFVRDLSPPAARELAAAGGLLDTGIAVGAADTLWAQARAWLPDHASRLAGSRHPDDLRAAFRSLSPASFSGAVLARSRRLGVIPLRGCDWTTLDSAAGFLACAEADERASAAAVAAEPNLAA